MFINKVIFIGIIKNIDFFFQKNDFMEQTLLSTFNFLIIFAIWRI